MSSAPTLEGALRFGILKLQRRQVHRPHITNGKDVARDLEDSSMWKKRTVPIVCCRDALEDLLHDDGLAAVVKSSLLPLIHRSQERDRLLEGVVSLEVRVETEERVDECLRARAVELADHRERILVGGSLDGGGHVLERHPRPL